MLAGDPAADSADKLPLVLFGCIRLSLDSDLSDFRSIFDCDDLRATGLGVARRESESLDEAPSSDSARFKLFCKSAGRLKFDSSLGKGSGSKSSRALRLYIVLRCFQIWSLVILRCSFLLSRSTMQTIKKC